MVDRCHFVEDVGVIKVEFTNLCADDIVDDSGIVDDSDKLGGGIKVCERRGLLFEINCSNASRLFRRASRTGKIFVSSSCPFLVLRLVVECASETESALAMFKSS